MSSDTPLLPSTPYPSQPQLLSHSLACNTLRGGGSQPAQKKIRSCSNSFIDTHTEQYWLKAIWKMALWRGPPHLLWPLALDDVHRTLTHPDKKAEAFHSALRQMRKLDRTCNRRVEEMKANN